MTGQVQELVKRGYHVIAFAREKSGIGGETSAEKTRQVASLTSITHMIMLHHSSNRRLKEQMCVLETSHR